MSEEPNLEERLSESTRQQTASLSLLDHLKYFVVDGTSSALFYAPIMTTTEYCSGMDAKEIATSRTIGAVTTFLTGYAYNSLLRKSGARIVGVNKESSWLKRKVVDISVGAATMMPFYAPMLYLAGASSKEMAIALFTGSLLGAAAGGMYGSVADKWRIFWGLEPVLNK
ncbi:MAG: L-alanine exporter AlaE [Nanoarchaeota archaeon]|nr:L-alanine exporter AlaE [Nanoarchaeota archaeon]